MLPDHSPSSVPRHNSLSLALLCVVQAIERFAFLAMLPLFALYSQDRHSITAPTALLVLAGFQALSYLGGLPAGWLADRVLGVRVSTLLGAGLLACGYGGLALDRTALFWPSLAAMVVGLSLFRTGLHVLIASAVGGTEQARERGFLWHYLAANLGYAAGPLFGEWSHARHGWAWLFGGAAVASAVGTALLAVGMPWLRGHRGEEHAPIKRASAATAAESMRAVWLLCAVSVVFWLTAQQANSSLAVFAATNTAQHVTALGYSLQVGPGHFASLHGLIVLTMLPAFLALHRRRGVGASSTTGKMLWGYVATSAAFALMAAAGLHGGDLGRVSGAWLVGCYLLLSIAEVLLAPLGVSLITQLAPRPRAAQAVGLWFAGCALGNALAGALGLCWDRWPHHRYFALLALLALGAAAVLLPRRRQLDWLTALSTSASAQLVHDERMDIMTSTPDLTTETQPSTSSTLSQPASRRTLLLVCLPILLPGSLVVNVSLPLSVRGISAIIGGLAVLLCGPYLFSHALVRWARRSTATNLT